MANTSVSNLTALRWDIAALAVMARALHLGLLARKAGFRPDQPRVPAGNPDGGQWTEDPSWTGAGGDERVPLVFVSDDGPPRIPEKQPPTTRLRNRWSVAVAQGLFANRIVVDQVVQWVWDHARDRIVAYLEPPRTLEELRQAVAEPRAGFDIHHIAEQTPARQDGFPESQINGAENLVRIPTYRHWEITAWYARGNPTYGGLSPREFLRGEPWEVRQAVGLKALRDFGVLKP